MLPILVMLATIPDQLGMPSGMNAIPVAQGTLQSADLPVPVSESVRAATWDDLAIKPVQPVHILVACIVIAEFGVPGSCVPTSNIAAGVRTVDWIKIRADNDKWEHSANPADIELLRIVNKRLETARAIGRPAKDSIFVIRLFEEIVSPEDARPQFVAGDALTMNRIRLAKPIDSDLLSKLYPAKALRSGVTARVNMTCDIQASLKLLCRDQGKIDLAVVGVTDTTGMIEDFRFATYQFASTLQLEPTSISGDAVAGKQLKLAMVWKIPK